MIKEKSKPSYEIEESVGAPHKIVCGVDEVGRGPLAGPVIAAAVILNPTLIPYDLNDSKKLSAKKREYLNEQILACAECAYGEASLEEIDELNKYIDHNRDYNIAYAGMEQFRGKYLIKNLVKASGKNELCDVSCKEIVDLEALDMSVLDFPQEKEYYHGITEKIKQTVSDELAGRNASGVVQDESSRRFIYSYESCISMIHFLVRDNELNVKCVLRSSNVETTLWADYEFLKIISCKFLEWINKIGLTIKFDVFIRSAHIIP